jgi:hypothetical protein
MAPENRFLSNLFRMKIKQLTVFLENKNGRLNEVAKVLGKEGINMNAFCIAENPEFGILRVLVSEPERAFEVLRTQSFAVKLVDVICINVPDTPGAMSVPLDILAVHGVNIEYMYAFSWGNTAKVVIRPENIDLCIEVLQQHKISLISADALYSL